MVLASLQNGGEELLAQPQGLRAYAEHGSTMGVPLLHPWANRLGQLRYEAAGVKVALDRDSPLIQLDEHGPPDPRGAAQAAGVGAARDRR